MIGDMWNALFKYGDEIKEKYGANSPQYEVIHELDRRFQQVYDKRNRLTREVLTAPAADVDDAIVKSIKGLKVVNDGDGLRYELNSYTHFDTLAEALDYIVRDYNKRYASLFKLFEDAAFKAYEASTTAMFNRASADFHEEFDRRKPLIRKKFDSMIGDSE